MKTTYFNLKEGQIDSFIKALNLHRKYEITTVQDLEAKIAKFEYGIKELSDGSYAIRSELNHFVLPKEELS